MSKLRKQEGAAIEAVVRHFCARWEQGEGPHDGYLLVGGKRIAVGITTVKQRGAQANLTEPRLRFDKVALRFVRGLHDALYEAVPDGKTMILTITAPIQMPSKTAAALENKIRSHLARRSVPAGAKNTIHGNDIEVRLVNNGLKRASNLIGFVHNRESDPDVVFDIAGSLIEHIGAAAEKRAPARTSVDRWLVLANEDGPSQMQTYRNVYSQLCIPNDFKKILMVFAGGRVETLAG